LQAFCFYLSIENCSQNLRGLWISRKGLAHRVSMAMAATFCLEAFDAAYARYGKPAIFNTDQGRPFTSLTFTEALKIRELPIGMNGRCGWRDNVLVERLWRTIKYEKVHAACLRLGRRRPAAAGALHRVLQHTSPHSLLGARTPDECYFSTPPAMEQAARWSALHRSGGDVVFKPMRSLFKCIELRSIADNLGKLHPRCDEEMS
jgi:putative transposase